MDTNLVTPQKLFEQQIQYEVPSFQRRYVWKEEEQWEPLWNDIQELVIQRIEAKEEIKPHFLGTVVLQQQLNRTGSVDRRIVVDGQQRLTTLQLLLDAIQRVLETKGFVHPAERLVDLVCNKAAYVEDNPNHKYKVWPSRVDHDAYKLAMDKSSIVDESNESNVLKAHTYFEDTVSTWLESFGDQNTLIETSAIALDKTVRENLQLVVIDLNANDDPHVIFETLNARGTPLLQSDMVKNKLLSEIGIEISTEEEEENQQNEVERVWSFDDDWWLRHIGRGVQRRPRIDVFLNNWLTLRNMSEVKAFEEFRTFIELCNYNEVEGHSIQETAKDLNDVGSLYFQIENNQIDSISTFIDRRNTMNLGSITPLLLALLTSKLDSNAFLKCIEAVESFCVRRVLCGYQARSYNELFIGLIKELWANDPESAVDTVVRYLSEGTVPANLWPKDGEVRDTIQTSPLYRRVTKSRLQMILKAIELSLRQDASEVLEFSPKLHIEHVMPQSWYKNWPLELRDYSEEEATIYRDQIVHTLGNLTLVTAKINARLSNSKWMTKRNVLRKHSVLLLNRSFLSEDMTNWNEDTISDRGDWMFKKIKQLWPHANELLK